MVSKERFFQKWKLKILITILSLCATNEIYWKCWNIWKKNPTRCINVSIITVKYVVISPGSKMIFCKNNLYSNKIVFIPVFIAFEFHELIAHRHHLRATRTTRGAKKKKIVCKIYYTIECFSSSFYDNIMVVYYNKAMILYVIRLREEGAGWNTAYKYLYYCVVADKKMVVVEEEDEEDEV